MRVADITAISSKLKSYCYQDLFQKPSEVMLYRSVEDGGLGLHHVQSKAQANLISTFVQTAANEKFRGSLFHSWLFRYHILGDKSLPDPGFTPYYDRNFFDVIDRLHQLGQSPTALCWCDSGEIETYSHLFFTCNKNQEAGQAVLRCLRSYDASLTKEKCLRIEFDIDEPFLLPSVSILSTSLEHIWNNRKQKKITTILSIRAELENSINIKRKSRLGRLQESANIMKNMVDNFLQ